MSSEPCRHERDYTTAQAMKSYIDAAKIAGDAAIERDKALAERDNALAEVARIQSGRDIEQTMLRNALPDLAALERVQVLADGLPDHDSRASTHWADCHKHHYGCLVVAIRAALEQP